MVKEHTATKPLKTASKSLEMDIVYVVRPGDENEALRYSLRSLANIPHRTVWIAGYRPKWCYGIVYVPRDQADQPDPTHSN